MPLELQPGLRYRMPVFFGPSAGPRQGPNGETYDYSNAPSTRAVISFLTDGAMLDKLLPPGFSRFGDPVVTVNVTCLTDLGWLAGRGYNMLGVTFPVRYQGRRDVATGPLLTILWENMPEPILTGREELGFSKLYCEIPAHEIRGGDRLYVASWDGHEFIRIRLSNVTDAAVPVTSAKFDGTLHYQYVPKIGAPGVADIERAVLTPAEDANFIVERHQTATGSIEFLPATWQQMPTMFQIANFLADLPILEIKGAGITTMRGGKDLSDQRVLE